MYAVSTSPPGVSVTRPHSPPPPGHSATEVSVPILQMAAVAWMVFTLAAQSNGSAAETFRRHIVSCDGCTDLASVRTHFDALMASVVSSGDMSVVRKLERVFVGVICDLTSQGVARLRGDEAVRMGVVVELASNLSAAGRREPLSWGLDRIDQPDLPLDSMFTSPVRGKQVHVYVMDSGIRASHHEFKGRIRTGYSAVAGSSEDTDDSGHGTHVAATIAGQGFGVAPAAFVHAIKVLDEHGEGTTATVIDGLEWLLKQSDHPKLAALPLAGDFSAMLDSALRTVVTQGIPVVAAAGNGGQDACTTSPASTDGVIAVGALTATDEPAQYSNGGRCVDVWAPGDDIPSAWGTGNDATRNATGTSVACAFAAGVAALILDDQPRTSPWGLKGRLAPQARDGRSIVHVPTVDDMASCSGCLGHCVCVTTAVPRAPGRGAEDPGGEAVNGSDSAAQPGALRWALGVGRCVAYTCADADTYAESWDAFIFWLILSTTLAVACYGALRFAHIRRGAAGALRVDVSPFRWSSRHVIGNIVVIVIEWLQLVDLAFSALVPWEGEALQFRPGTRVSAVELIRFFVDVANLRLPAAITGGDAGAPPTFLGFSLRLVFAVALSTHPVWLWIVSLFNSSAAFDEQASRLQAFAGSVAFMPVVRALLSVLSCTKWTPAKDEYFLEALCRFEPGPHRGSVALGSCASSVQCYTKPHDWAMGAALGCFALYLPACAVERPARLFARAVEEEDVEGRPVARRLFSADTAPDRPRWRPSFIMMVVFAKMCLVALTVFHRRAVAFLLGVHALVAAGLGLVAGYTLVSSRLELAALRALELGAVAWTSTVALFVLNGAWGGASPPVGPVNVVLVGAVAFLAWYLQCVCASIPRRRQGRLREDEEEGLEVEGGGAPAAARDALTVEQAAPAEAKAELPTGDADSDSSGAGQGDVRAHAGETRSRSNVPNPGHHGTAHLPAPPRGWRAARLGRGIILLRPTASRTDGEHAPRGALPEDGPHAHPGNEPSRQRGGDHSQAAQY